MIHQFSENGLLSPLFWRLAKPPSVSSMFFLNDKISDVRKVCILWNLIKNELDPLGKHNDGKEINYTHKTKQSVNPYSMIQTTNNNKEYLTQYKIKGAER